MSRNRSISNFTHPKDEVLNEYLDGYLPPAEIGVLEAHIADCPACGARLNTLQSVFASLEFLPALRLERDLTPNILAAIQPKTRLSGVVTWSALAQTALAMIVLLVTAPILADTWTPTLAKTQDAIATWLSDSWAELLTLWTSQMNALQLNWSHWLIEWQSPSLFEVTHIAIWPIFLSAALLFIVGNGVLLRKLTQNGAC